MSIAEEIDAPTKEITIKKQVIISEDRSITIQLPIEVPPGEAVVRMMIEYEKPKNRVSELRGTSKGKIWMADDFDAPLEDFGDSKAICASDEEKAELRAALNPKKITPALLELAGSLAGSETFAGDPVAIIREIRDEW